MDILFFVATYTVVIGGCGYICFVGEPEEPGFVNTANRILTRDAIECVRWSLFKVVGSRGVEAYDGLEEWLCWSANPLLQLFYLVLILGGFSSFITFGLPFVECSELVPCIPLERAAGTCPFLSSWHRATAYATMATCLLSWAFCCLSDPGYADEKSPMDVYCYEWDGFVHTRKVCAGTDRLLRPARSSFCRYSNRMVLRFDHFCPWIKNAVGENNYRYFLFFLMMHWFTLGYAAWGTGKMLLGRLEEERYWHRDQGRSQIYDPQTGLPRMISWSEVFRVMLMLENKVMLLCIFCSFLSFVIFLFWAYHIYLTCCNITTNESVKRGRLRSKFVSMIEAEALMVGGGTEPSASELEPELPAVRGDMEGKGGTRRRRKDAGSKRKGPPDASNPAPPQFGSEKKHSELSLLEHVDNIVMAVSPVGRATAGLFAGFALGWFVGWVLGYGTMGVSLSGGAGGGIGAALLSFVPLLLGWGRPHVHMPNVYDRGAWQNFAEVVWPRSQRLDAVSVVSSRYTAKSEASSGVVE